MKKALGILGGMGPLATADLFRKIVTNTRAACDNDHIRIYIDDNSAIPDRTGAILHGGPSPVPEMTDSLRKLEACGAECIIMPCNTAHYYLKELSSLTDIPFISIMDATANCCKASFPGKTACILGTAATLEMGLYDKALSKEGIPFVKPDADDTKRLMHVIYDGVKAGAPLHTVADDWETVLANGRARGADYFILGCTELPIIAEGLSTKGDFIDPTYALAKAAIEFCGYEAV